GEVEADVGAIAMPDDRRPLDLERIEKLEQVVGHVVGRVATRSHVAVSVSTEVVRERAEAVRDHRDDLQVPDGEVSGEAMNHYEVGTLADLLVVEPCAVAERHLRHLSSFVRLTRRIPEPGADSGSLPARRCRTRLPYPVAQSTLRRPRRNAAAAGRARRGRTPRLELGRTCRAAPARRGCTA